MIKHNLRGELTIKQTKAQPVEEKAYCDAAGKEASHLNMMSNFLVVMIPSYLLSLECPL